MNHDEKLQRKRESDKRWRAANPEKVREHSRRYHTKHREKRLQQMREYYRTMKEKAKKYDEMTGGAEGE